MSEPRYASWLPEPLSPDVADAVERLRRAPDVQRVAVMPDVHLANDVCVGVAVATSNLIYPQAVGGDIGCGMFAVAFDVKASALSNPRVAGGLLRSLGEAIPARRRNRSSMAVMPADLASYALADARLESLRRGVGAIEFATLGSGNHFLELQEDDEGRLWLMLHSGSRALGPAIRDHYLGVATPVGGGLRALDASSEAGACYLRDAEFARRYAQASRRAMTDAAGVVIARLLRASPLWDTLIVTDHNHVARERFGSTEHWVHRKGAMSAGLGALGVLPGSMGTLSFHVEGRGNEEALRSSAHGAGRALSRTDARRRVRQRDLFREMGDVWFDHRLAEKLRDEAPSAYKDIRSVLRAQQDLVKVIRTLRPVLNYKGL